MVYVDTSSNGWCHMVADDIPSLHEFADKIGVKRCWYQNKKGKCQPHYDLTEANRLKAINNGAIQITRKQLFNFLKETYNVLSVKGKTLG